MEPTSAQSELLRLAAVVHVDSYTRTSKDGNRTRVRRYTRKGQLSTGQYGASVKALYEKAAAAPKSNLQINPAGSHSSHSQGSTSPDTHSLESILKSAKTAAQSQPAPSSYVHLVDQRGPGEPPLNIDAKALDDAMRQVGIKLSKDLNIKLRIRGSGEGLYGVTERTHDGPESYRVVVYVPHGKGTSPGSLYVVNNSLLHELRHVRQNQDDPLMQQKYGQQNQTVGYGDNVYELESRKYGRLADDTGARAYKGLPKVGETAGQSSPGHSYDKPIGRGVWGLKPPTQIAASHLAMFQEPEHSIITPAKAEPKTAGWATVDPKTAHPPLSHFTLKQVKYDRVYSGPGVEVDLAEDVSLTPEQRTNFLAVVKGVIGRTKPKATVTIKIRHGAVSGGATAGMMTTMHPMNMGESLIYVPDFTIKQDGEFDNLGTSKKMSARDKAGTLPWYLAHEMGHALVNQRNDDHPKGRADSAFWRKQGGGNYDADTGMSTYGRSDMHEGYAEAFAQWTFRDLDDPDSPSAKIAAAYAQKYQWPGGAPPLPEKPKAPPKAKPPKPKQMSLREEMDAWRAARDKGVVSSMTYNRPASVPATKYPASALTPLVPALNPKWTPWTSSETEAALNKTPEGAALFRMLWVFQNGGSNNASGRDIPLLRHHIEKVLNGNTTGMLPSRVYGVKNLLNAIASVDEGDHTLYRGMKLNGSIDHVQAKYKVGDDMNISLASFTESPTMARAFTTMGAGEKPGKAVHTTPVIVQWEGDKHPALPLARIADDSIMSAEKEWITSGQFSIVSVKRVRRGDTISLVLVIKQKKLWV